jgi:hypothetical protein
MTIQIIYDLNALTFVISEYIPGTVALYNEQSHGLIQAEYPIARLQAITVGLDIRAIDEWMLNEYEELPATSTLNKVILDRAFGQQMINKYLALNKGLELTVNQSLAQLTKFSSVKMLLEVGAIQPALTLIQSTVVDDVYTQERKDSDIVDIEAYLG